ncbi:MAG: MinD/ParA family protein [candidate division Zixibacteria bacterium]|nr:MinD/ParA family protein [candidate division Zixibacteria bacterium]
MSKSEGSRFHKNPVITICSGKGGTGKTTVVRTLVDMFGDEFRIAVIDGALGLSGISSVYGVIPEASKSYQCFLGGSRPASDFIEKVENINLIPSHFSGSAADFGIERDFHRVDELIAYLSRDNDLVIIDSASGLDLGLYEYLSISDIVLIVVTTDPQSITDGYSIAKLCMSVTPHPITSFFLNMIESEVNFHEFNTKMTLLSRKFLFKELRALGYMKFDKPFMKSPGETEFRSMLGNDNRNNLESFKEKLTELIGSNRIPDSNWNEQLNREFEMKSYRDLK